MSVSPIRHSERPVTPMALLDDGPGADVAFLRRLLALVRAHPRALVWGTLAGAAIGLAAAAVWPPTFVATCTLLEAPKSSASSIDPLNAAADMLGLRSGGASSNALTYPDILRSRRLLGALLSRAFTDARGHTHVLETLLASGPAGPARTERALTELRRRLDVALDRRTNLLRLGVSDRDATRAAAIANAAAAELQTVIVDAMTTQAGAQRRFIEQRLAEARRSLARAEESYRAFGEGNRRGSSPSLALQTARLARDVRTQEEIMLVLTRQYEMAKVDERRELPVLNVLDAATPPAFARAPRRALLVAAAALLGTSAALIACAMRVREPEPAA